MNTLSHKKLIVIKFYSSKCYTYFIGCCDASATITKNKSAELITENECVEEITENETAENYPLERMLADLKHQNIIYTPDASCEGKEKKANRPRNYSYTKRKFGKDEKFFAFVV